MNEERNDVQMENEAWGRDDDTWMHPPKKEPRPVSLAEKLLLHVSLLVAILFDRLVVSEIFNVNFMVFVSIFWICYMLAFYGFYWKRLKQDVVGWIVAACILALCVWNFVHNQGNDQFAVLTFLVLPAVVLAHGQWTAGGYSFREYDGMAVAWVLGLIIKPFSGIWSLFEAFGSLFAKANKPALLRVLIGVGAAAFALLIIIPLLMGADQMFGHHLSRIFASFSLPWIAIHAIIITIVFGLLYSLWWNVGFGSNEKHKIPETWAIDPLISGIVLGSILAVYVLFVAVMSTYLFAGAGLPEGMTYAQYARAGFAQTVAVCALNLGLFGVFLKLGKKNQNVTRILLTCLLVLTGLMLFSGGVRLHLYIDTFGMTWLRLLSLWFLIYLTVVVSLCAIRLFKRNFPVLPLAALILLVWFVVLGFLNPDGFVVWFNYDLMEGALRGF